MSANGWIERQVAEWDADPDFILEGVLLAVNERICELMQEKKISRAELARRLGRSRAYVTRLLNGQPNVTLKTLTQIAVALGEGIEVFIPSSVTEERGRAARRGKARRTRKRVAAAAGG